LNILFCIDQYRPSRGGAEKYLSDLAAALAERGHSITVAALEAEEDDVVAQLKIRAPRFPRVLRETVFASKAARLKRGGTFDRVVGFRHMLDVDRFQPHEGLFVDSLRGSIRPVSTNPALRRLLFFRKLLSPKNLFFLYADRRLFRRNPGLKTAALSSMTARSIGTRYGAWKPDIAMIPNGVERARFKPHPGEGSRIREELRIPSRSRILLFVAHNFRLKGLREALEGFSRYLEQKGDALFLVAGRGKAGPYRKIIQSRRLEHSVIFLGPRSDMIDLYAAADLLVHPTFYDPCSLVVLEAFGAGVPVITTRYNGAAELMQGRGAGRILEDPRDSQAMAEAVREILDGGDYDSFAREAARIGEENSFETHVEKVEKWIKGE
jgi:UDP-glucose:(heptosyl)LPS alpha-1,3-glucosyltransferase